MNVRVQPTVRCTFVPEENVVRLILKENVETLSSGSSEGGTKLEVVIYAIKVCGCFFIVLSKGGELILLSEFL
jgi:hypothetical protein